MPIKVALLLQTISVPYIEDGTLLRHLENAQNLVLIRVEHRPSIFFSFIHEQVNSFVKFNVV